VPIIFPRRYPYLLRSAFVGANWLAISSPCRPG